MDYINGWNKPWYISLAPYAAMIIIPLIIAGIVLAIIFGTQAYKRKKKNGEKNGSLRL